MYSMDVWSPVVFHAALEALDDAGLQEVVEVIPRLMHAETDSEWFDACVMAHDVLKKIGHILQGTKDP